MGQLDRTKSKLNKAWHDANPMPAKATLKERIAWHKTHAKECACRPIPRTIVDALRKLH